ncbi:MAG: LysM peptidoglycan-binding domain-containing protein [Anaerolineae bacterium]
MSKRQLALVIIINAVISAVVSFAVVRAALRQWEQGRPAYLALPWPSPTPSATPPQSEILYVAQPGDSLSSIALRFRVSLEDLMRANGITDPDYINVGQKLLIPAGASPIITRAPAPTYTPAAPPTPLFTDTPPARPSPTLSGPALKVIAVFDAGDPQQEALYLANTGAEPMDLTGWTVSDGRGHIYRFPAVALQGHGTVILHTGAGQDDEVNLYWGLDTALWKDETTVLVKDAGGRIVVQYEVR